MDPVEVPHAPREGHLFLADLFARDYLPFNFMSGAVVPNTPLDVSEPRREHGDALELPTHEVGVSGSAAAVEIAPPVPVVRVHLPADRSDAVEPLLHDAG
jgi:hypothetical protein